MCRTQCVLALVALFLGLAHSWDFALSVGDRLEFYTNKTKTDTVHFDSQNLTALAYDEVHNMLLYVNKQSDNDTICGYNISSVEYKCYIEKSGRDIQGLAFDPITEMLFFTDTKERSINSISFKPGSENNIYGNLIIKMADGIPTDIAVDSCRGYVYWINTNLTTSTIERARFNGSERKVIINASYNWDLHSLAIDPHTQKIYWVMPRTSLDSYVYIADLSGNNHETIVKYYIQLGDKTFVAHSNRLSISNEYLFMLSWCSSCSSRKVWQYSKPTIKTDEYTSFLKVNTESSVGIAAKYKINEKIQGFQECTALTSLVPNSYMTDDSLKIAREYEEPFCDHGIKINGQSHCKCTPGYIGKRCDVSVCENYCLQGDCFTEEGLSKCRCNAGYSGERCEVNVCHGHCSNNGSCSINEESEPVCQCVDDYAGDRCEVSDCVNYCLQGDCSYNEEGLPECRCNAGYSGERCEVDVCYRYCSNNGTCSINKENEPVCECVDGYAGDRCDVPVCLKNGDCSLNEEGSRCKADKNITLSSTSTYYTAERNLTLADLLAKWRKPVTTISVVVEVKSN